jgi:hypothetical protein
MSFSVKGVGAHGVGDCSFDDRHSTEDSAAVDPVSLTDVSRQSADVIVCRDRRRSGTHAFRRNRIPDDKCELPVMLPAWLMPRPMLLKPPRVPGPR